MRDPIKKVLEILLNHREGCTLFIDHPETPLDNDESERRLALSGANHMAAQSTGKPSRYCGRRFTAEEMAWIRRLLAPEP